jgi:protein-disulfide isomerase
MKQPRCRLIYGLVATVLGAGLAAPTARAGGVKTGRTSAVVHTPASQYPIRGSASAVLNVIYWAGFKNPTSQQVQKVLRQMMTRYRGKVRLQFMNKYRDGSHYKIERYAAAAAREAFVQGGDRLFWKFHDAILKHPNLYTLTEAVVKRVARNVGMNLAQLNRAMSSGRHTKAVAAERDLSVRFGVPTYNSSVVLMVGQELMHISRYTRWYYLDAVVKRNLKVAQAHSRSGLGAGQVREKMLAAARKRYRRWHRSGSRYKRPTTRKYTKRHNIPVAHSPTQGPKTAWVTVVAFLDFSDYSCWSAWNYLIGIQAQHKKRMRLVFKAMPRRYYSYALGAARAAYAAQAQGRFWQMAKILFQNRWRLYPSRLAGYAKRAGLDVARFKKDARSPKMSQRVLKDMQLARKIGVTKGPVVFINGRRPGRIWNQYVFAATLKKELQGGLLSRVLGR